MNVRSFGRTLLAGSILAVGTGLAPMMATAQTAPHYGTGYGGSYGSGATTTAPGLSGGSDYRSGGYGDTHYGSTVPMQRSSGTLMPTETAPPDAVRDPKLWEQWQQHGQYEYERGYEAGRKDAMTHRRADMREDHAPYPSTTAGTATRMSERYEGPSFRGPSAGEPWWATNWDRMASDWPRLREEIRRRWPQLSGADVEMIEGQRAMLLTVIQDRYRLSNERAHEQVLAWQQQLRG